MLRKIGFLSPLALAFAIAACDAPPSTSNPVDHNTTVIVNENTPLPAEECPRADGQPCR